MQKLGKSEYGEKILCEKIPNTATCRTPQSDFVATTKVCTSALVNSLCYLACHPTKGWLSANQKLGTLCIDNSEKLLLNFVYLTVTRLQVFMQQTPAALDPKSCIASWSCFVNWIKHRVQVCNILAVYWPNVSELLMGDGQWDENWQIFFSLHAMCVSAFM